MKHPFIKKFIIIYLSAVALVLIYFLFKTLFIEDKEIELKSFNTPKSKNEISTDKIEYKETGNKFLLLPKR